MLPQLVALAAGWVKKMDRQNMIGGFGAIEPGDQEQLELLAYQTLWSPTGSELRRKAKGRGTWRAVLWRRLPAAPAPSSQGARAAEVASCGGEIHWGPEGVSSSCYW